MRAALGIAKPARVLAAVVALLGGALPARADDRGADAGDVVVDGGSMGLDAGAPFDVDAGLDAGAPFDVDAGMAEPAAPPVRDGGIVLETVIQAAPDAPKPVVDAVTVVHTERTQKESAGLGDVLARTEGVSVQQGGGLGSNVRVSLDGLSDNAVRILVDGIPLEMAGFGVGLASIPLDFVDRVEVFSGVVPIRFGADALGGVINVVTEDGWRGAGGTASYQLGSFDTNRLALGAHYGSPEGGYYVRTFGFLDYTLNDYRVHVGVPDALGQVVPTDVTLFHNRYRAQEGGVEGGLVQQPWADKVSLRAFASHNDAQLQDNLYMTIPYGEPVYRQYDEGLTAHYVKAFGGERALKLDVTGGFGHEELDFVDDGRWVYNWFGQQLRARRVPGESDIFPHDTSNWQNSLYARVNLSWQPTPDDLVQLSSAPTAYNRTGIERLLPTPTSPDPLRGTHRITDWINGLAYQRDLLGRRLENQVFIKDYQYAASTNYLKYSTQPTAVTDSLNRVGVGDLVTFQPHPAIALKASYEYAIRLPEPDELFGDGERIVPNALLEPERSHNGNLGFELHPAPIDGAGTFTAQAGGFWREQENLIFLNAVTSNGGTGVSAQYQNVFGARSLGGQAAVGWVAPRRWAEIGLNGTYQDVRNTSSQGLFGGFAGDRIPSQPWLFANASVRLNARHFLSPAGELSLAWYGHYVGGFLLGWESIGSEDTDLRVPEQFSQTAALTWSAYDADMKYATSVEVDNLTDARLFDFYGAQRPGRAVFAKLSLLFGSTSRPGD